MEERAWVWRREAAVAKAARGRAHALRQAGGGERHTSEARVGSPHMALVRGGRYLYQNSISGTLPTQLTQISSLLILCAAHATAVGTGGGRELKLGVDLS